VIIDLVGQARASGARLEPCCELLGLDVRTVQRWLDAGLDGEGDRRKGPLSEPANKLTPSERREIVEVATAPEFVDLSPKQIVPTLADMGIYVGSESSFYRVLEDEKMLAHRGRAKAATRRRPDELASTGPCQVWCWDISYIAGPVRGQWYYLYLFEDVWSRMIVGWAVLENESTEQAAALLHSTCEHHQVNPEGLALHSDNGGPMKGATMLATMQRLGIVASFSRPQTSDDNAFIESLFRTAKYRPSYPSGGFASLEAAKVSVAAFVLWYNEEHQHSAIRFVTPADRHYGREDAILAHRHEVYESARARRPDRWSGATRNWKPIEIVKLNPRPSTIQRERGGSA
jgi:putative transposase